jgi:multidrug efflux pump subunit AcrA (membrane-fusion protein)
LTAFVLKAGGRVERRRLEIGRSDGEFTEVLAGLVAGEEVVSSGGRELQTAYASLR